MSEVKSAMLHSFEGGKAVLIVVDEDYQIDTVSGDVNTLRYLVSETDLPNFVWRHNTNDPGIRTVDTDGNSYLGRRAGWNAMKALNLSGKKKAAS